MSNDKKKKKRLGIYLLIVFTFSVMSVLAGKLAYSFRIAWETSSLLFGFSPAIACIVTRLVTNEGFEDMKLNFHFRGNLRYYILAMVLPLTVGLAYSVLPFIISGNRDFFANATPYSFISAVLTLTVYTGFAWITMIGEELGWRGYMNQKMEPLFGTVGTCLLGGLVWGIWHFPGNLCAVLYGSGSLSEALKMDADRILMCILTGVVLMYLTKMTGSVIPAAIYHFIQNGSLNLGMTAARVTEDLVPTKSESFTMDLCFLVLLAVYAAIFLMLMLKDKKKKVS